MYTYRVGITKSFLPIAVKSEQTFTQINLLLFSESSNAYSTA